MVKMKPFRMAALAILFSVGTLASLNAQISGTVFRDYNGNGTRQANEPLMPGVTINAYNAAGAICGTATSVGGSATPNYTLSGCGTGQVRVEFVLPTGGVFVDNAVDFPALGGVTYGTSVQFVSGNSSNVNFAMQAPVDYNVGPANITNFLPCYVSGDPLAPGSAAGAMDWFVGYPYTNDGNSPGPALKADGSVLGATWGVAYSKQADRVFTSAFIKRHVGLGVLGTGGIYMLEPTATSFNVTPFYDMDANGYRTRAAASAPAYGEGSSYTLPTETTITFLGAVDPVSGEPEGLGVVGVNGPGGRGLPTNPGIASYDPAAFGQVAKVGLGGLEISDDGRFLFVMNLYSKSVFRLELNDPYNPTAVVNVTEIPVPTVACNNGVLRPFALTYHRGELYAGAVCDGEISQSRTDLFAYVFRMDNANTGSTFTASPVLSQSLDYRKGQSYALSGGPRTFDFWVPWEDRVITSGGGGVENFYDSEPVLSDIEFANNGQMIVNFFDRTGHKHGQQNYQRLRTDDGLSGQMAPGGEIWAVGLNANGNFEIEVGGNFESPDFDYSSSYTSNGVTFTSGPPFLSQINFAEYAGNRGGVNGHEFFTGDWYRRLHYETSVGSGSYLPGQAYYQQVVMDPAHIGPANSGGTRQMRLNDGGTNAVVLASPIINVPSGYYIVFQDADLGKANGLGELELSGPDSPLEIGNYVWLDADADGIQDPGELPLPGVTVELWKETSPGTFTQIATVITDANGRYFFTSATGTSALGITYGVSQLQPEMNYELRFPTTTTVGANVFAPTVANMGGADANADARDSDADPATGVVAFTTEGFGSNNHSFDVGFRVAVANLEMEKTFVSALPDGSGNFDVTYTITVTETGGVATTYDLTDTPGFDDDITINSGGYSLDGAPVVSFPAPANNQTETLATAQAIAGNTTQAYTVTFNVSLDLLGGGGDNLYNPCDATTPTPGQGLYNLATITTNGMSGDDDDCGDLFAVTHTKELTSVSTLNGDGSYDVSYTITVTHLGGIAGQYDLADIPGFDDDFTINNASFTSSAPPGLSGSLSTTIGATNLLGDDVPISPGQTHTYTVNFNVSLDLTGGGGDNVYTLCGATTGTPQAGEGLFNQSTLDLNDDGIPEETDEACTFTNCPSQNCADTLIQND